jgi:ubiquinone biosynthesis protein
VAEVRSAAVAEAPAFEVLKERKPPGLLRRYLITQRHLIGLLFGGLIAYVRSRPRLKRGLGFQLLRVLSWVVRPFTSRRFVDLPFPRQLRKRLEELGPTYIKLGQILSLREDLLPRPITDELKNLLDRLPALAFPRFVELIEEEVGQPIDNVFSYVDDTPLGSASIGQTHHARTLDGDEVVLKLVKPGIRRTIQRDVILLRILGRSLQLFLRRLQPKRVIDEFCDYTLREVDLLREADNAETFAANFKDETDIVFPRIYRRWSTRNLLCMELLDGVKPDSFEAQSLPRHQRDVLTDLGAGAIIQMLYQDGFFHADLHPGNLLVLEGPRVGFIDLGMVGRFDDELRRNLLYYYYCLVMGDAENAARYLAALADPTARSDPKGFRREVEEIAARWHRTPTFHEYSIGQLILESVSRGARYHMYFPVELVLMVKAIVTFEGVGQILNPGFDVVEVSKIHIGRIFAKQFSPLRIAREGLRGAPELVDALVKAPMLVTEGLRVLEQHTRQPRENPFSGIRGTVFAGFLFVAGAILAGFEGPTWLWATLFAVGILVAMRRGE